jgi:hypothetical protein
MKPVPETVAVDFCHRVGRLIARHVLPDRMRAIDENRIASELESVTDDYLRSTCDRAYSAALDARDVRTTLAARDALDALDALAARTALASRAILDARAARTALAALAAHLLDAAIAAGLEVPVIPNLDAAVLSIVEHPETPLDMSSYHGDDDPENWCGTTHCRFGAAIVAADAWELEKAVGPWMAGALLYLASRRAQGKPERIPNAFEKDDEAMADIKACAAG